MVGGTVMILYDLLKVFNTDFDTYDNVYDAVVTVCSFDEEDEKSDEYYEKFCIGIMKFIEVTKGSKQALWCNWSDFIKRNIQIFREFEAKYWCKHYENEDDFIYQWIKEIDYWVAGEASEHIYKEFVENYMSRMR